MAQTSVMTTFLLTLLLTFILIVLVMSLFWRFGSPVYRVERANVIRLLELVLSEEATEVDWNVFCAIPIRHDDELARVQRHCIDIAEREYLGGRGKLFTRKGTDELQHVLTKLKNEAG